MGHWLESLGLFWKPPDPRSRRAIEDDIAAELDFHVALRAEELERAGLARDAARTEAQRRFGDRARVAKECRKAQMGERVMLQRIQAGALVVLLLGVAWLAWTNHRNERASAVALAAMTEQMKSLEERIAGMPALPDPRASAGGSAASQSDRDFVFGDLGGPAPDRSAGERGASESATAIAARADAIVRQLNADNHWRISIALGDDLAKLPPDEGLAVVRSIWPRIESPEQRRQMLKSFAQVELHPRALPILDLAMRDPDLGVQDFAIVYLRPIALIDFASSYAAYDEWFAKHGAQPLDAVIRESAGNLVTQLRAGDSASALAALSYLRAEPAASVGVDLPKLLRDAGLLDWVAAQVAVDDARIDPAIAPALAVARPDFEWIARWIVEGGARRTVAEQVLERSHEPLREADVAWLLDSAQPELHVIAFANLARTTLSAEFLAQRIVPIATDPAHGPEYAIEGACAALAIAPRDSAIGPLLAGLRLVPRERASLRLRYVDALCKLKDARALPELIGLLESAADPVTGERIDQALCQLTGVSAPRDAAWWRQWWDENQRRLPAGVKATPIPDYSETQR